MVKKTYKKTHPHIRFRVAPDRVTLGLIESCGEVAALGEAARGLGGDSRRVAMCWRALEPWSSERWPLAWSNDANRFMECVSDEPPAFDADARWSVECGRRVAAAETVSLRTSAARNVNVPAADQVPFLAQRWKRFADEPLTDLPPNSAARIHALLAHELWLAIAPLDSWNDAVAVIALHGMLTHSPTQPASEIEARVLCSALCAAIHPELANARQRAHDGRGSLIDVVETAVVFAVRTLREICQTAREAESSELFRGAVLGSFEGESSACAQRRARLAAALAHVRGRIRKRDVIRVAPELASTYATLSKKTLSRDLAELEHRGWLTRVDDAYLVGRRL